MTAPSPHDLVRIRSASALRGTLPPWAQAALRRAPWVVVRRDATAADILAVGVRGTTRAERHPTAVGPVDVVETLTPAALLGRLDRLPDLPATAALHDAIAVLDGVDVEWGPGGSVGFTAATGVCAMTAASDLDLVIRTANPPAAQLLTHWHRAFAALSARVDCHLDLPAGGVALADLVSDAPHVLLRTARGPRLVSRTDLAA